MSPPASPTLKDKIRRALDEKARGEALSRAMTRGRGNRAKAILARAGGDSFRDEVKAVKERCIENLDSLVQRFSAKARQRGAQVFFAKDGPAAIEYILKVSAARGARTVAKSKSLTSEEIQVNHPLEHAGMQVIETDLGELIIQRVHEKPYHLVFPAVHKTAAEVAEIFRNVADGPLPPDPKEIMKVVRRYLRPIFLDADIGMTGANVAIAENGSIVIETNEGNARLVSSIPDCHICIMGMEKIVETVDEALLMALAHPISAVGQTLTTYVTFMGGRSALGAGEGRKPRESHIVILDNGRTAMRADPHFRDALNCIRCGACMNICPTYGVVGGHTFGYIYPGPIGIPWTAEVHGQQRAGEFAPLCISCGLCKEICPAEIDIPMMIAEVKRRDMALRPQPVVNRAMMAADSLARFGSATAPLSNWMMQLPPFRWLLEKIAGLDRKRSLPAFARPSFEKRFKQRELPAPTSPPARQVAFFVDIYANYNAPDLGMAAIERLEERGCAVSLPPQRPSGYPFIAYGDLDRAREAADYNVRRLAPYAERGFDIVAVEPTAAYCLRIAYKKLLDGRADAKLVAERSYELFEYLMRLEAEAPPPDRERRAETLKGRRFGFHISCHQRPLGSGRHAMEWLRLHGAEVEVVETGTCCGMGGTFGLKAGPLGRELSEAVGEPLFKAFRDAGIAEVVTESSVCSIQLRDGLGLPLYHPLELLRVAAGKGDRP